MLQEKEKGNVEENAFEALEKDFQEVLNELMGDKSLERFRIEYEKLHRALKKSHDNEKRLMTRCRELNAEIVTNSVKVSTALKLSQDDQSTITTLKQEIEKAWKMVDAAHDQEKRGKETIHSLKEEIAKLTRLVEQGAGLSLGQESGVDGMLQAKDELVKERDELYLEITVLRNQLADLTTQQHEAEHAKEEADQSISQLQRDIQMRENEVAREMRRKERLEKEVKRLQGELEAKQAEIKQLQVQQFKNKEEHHKVEHQLKEQKILNERLSKDLEVLHHRFTKLQVENEQQVMITDQLMHDNTQKMIELKTREDEVSHMRQEITKLNKVKEVMHRKMHVLEDHKTDLENQRETLKNLTSGLDRELEAVKKQADIDKKAIDELVRERDILNKNVLKAISATDKQLNLVKLHEQSKKVLENEIQNYKNEAHKQRKIILHLEKERDRYINETSALSHRVYQNMEDINARDLQNFEYKKKIADAMSKLRHQQTMFETVRNDRNLQSKNLIEAKDEITEMKRKLKVTNHHIDQLKEEISSKEAALVRQQLEHQRMDKEKEALKAELQKMKRQAQETKMFIESQETEEKKLLRIISEADTERLRQKKELDQVITERDILGTQLVRRNDELALLYEKIKIQQSMLNKGEMQYRQRVEDIRLLKLEIKKLRREKAILTKTVANVDDLRRELYHVQRELLKERTRCRALEEELENPMNVHRWRKLEASDPSTYELIMKIHTLQKRLIAKTEEVVEKELLLQEKEKLYVELKHILARQPGPETAEQLQIYQKALREKTRQLKALTSELNMFESQSQEYKYEIDRLSLELQNIQKKYHLQKRKEQQTKEKEKQAIDRGTTSIQPQKTNHPQITGGGFNFKQPTQVTA
ncbi:cilia- and flagella-associated protein 58 [Callorhinchus milii]|uniref:cilia- and flagella-associated protein 58 n=1 Tax=Callorhinchus milii TaxID=7868 RepID=UPI0004575E4E|nr:cilia- and flagella-associated protein 58 [Callorhinchus milii]|eukprot:gi/632970750/ref/XP_007901821.1/ PREDICTED: coiled-coil domain-containing protein 147 [Callorhinchus milii]